MKVIEDILREVDMEVLRKAPHAQRKYNKITESLRSRFLIKILNEGKSIKKAAEELNINYSSAKTILTMHRKKLRASGSSGDLVSLTEDSQIDKALPPKNQIKQSFMSTASNLSELKDSSESSEENHHEEIPKLSSFAKISKNVVIVQPPKQNTTTQQQPSEQEQQISAVSPAILTQIQQQIQAQQQLQQQQQLQNTLQQLLLLQNVVFPQQNQQQQEQINPLAQLLLQQQLMMLNPLGLPNWI